MSKPKIMSQFSGALNLGDPEGTLYLQHQQSGAITLSVANGSPGGWALVPIVADGNAINVPAAWILYGGDAISIVVDDVNHIQVFYKDADTIYYTNKVA